jgi:hypothetical protein
MNQNCIYELTIAVNFGRDTAELDSMMINLSNSILLLIKFDLLITCIVQAK